MKRIHALLASFTLALLAAPSWAAELRVAADTAGSVVTNKITKLAGTATTLPVTAKSSAFLSFGAGASGIDPASITGARLVIYFSKVTKGGNLTVAANATAFQEKFTTATIATPTADPFGSVTVPIVTQQTRSYVVIRGLETIVQLWLTDPSSDFGVALTGDATLNARLASKEGPGVGDAATLEIDVASGGGGGGGGDITVNSVTSTGAVIGALVKSTGAVTGASVTSSGALTGGSLAISGSGQVTGDLTATGNINGAAFGASSVATDTLTVHGATNFEDAVTIKNSKSLKLEGTGGIIVGGGIDATGNVTASAFASSSVATDNLTAHVNANLQGTSTFGGKATFNGSTVFLADMTLGSNKTLGGGGSVDLGGSVQAQDGRFGSTLSVGSAALASRGTLDVRGTLARAGTGTGFSFINPGSPFVGTGTDGGFGTGIFCDSQIVGAGLNAISDARIKDIQGRSDASADLSRLLQIEITDYFFKDRVSHGDCPQKKVIAQQVEKIFPQAISLHTDVVPDIFQKARLTDGWVQLATDLQVGDRVRLLGAKPGEDGVFAVLEVRESAFRTAFRPEAPEIFVYGREVNDFRTVDYDAIAMLNVSATQELARRLAAKETEFTKLRAAHEALAEKLSAFEKRDAELQARLTRLEAGLSARPPQIIRAALKP